MILGKYLTLESKVVITYNTSVTLTDTKVIKSDVNIEISNEEYRFLVGYGSISNESSDVYSIGKKEVLDYFSTPISMIKDYLLDYKNKEQLK